MCHQCVAGSNYSDGTAPCSDKCPLFSSSEELCNATGFCLWNSKFRVCYKEERSTFTEIVIEGGQSVEDIKQVFADEGKTVVVVVDTSGRTVIYVEGEVSVEEATRAGVEVVQEIEAGAVAASEVSSSGEGNVSKAAFVSGVTVGGIAIVGLGAGIVMTALNLRSTTPAVLSKT